MLLEAALLFGQLLIIGLVGLSGIDLDMVLIPLQSYKLSYVLGVVGLIGAQQVLLLMDRTLYHHRNDQIYRGYLVVAIGPS